MDSKISLVRVLALLSTKASTKSQRNKSQLKSSILKASKENLKKKCFKDKLTL